MSINETKFPDVDNTELNHSSPPEKKIRTYSGSSDTSTVTADSDFACDNFDGNSRENQFYEANNGVPVHELMNDIIVNVIEMNASPEVKMNRLLQEVSVFAKNKKTLQELLA